MNCHWASVEDSIPNPQPNWSKILFYRLSTLSNGRVLSWFSKTIFRCVLLIASVLTSASVGWPYDDSMKKISIRSEASGVQPMTGIVLWTTNEKVDSSPIQLEYSYFTYSQFVSEANQYDWSKLDRLLDQVSQRGHQLIVRFHDTYVGKKTGVPKYILALNGYETTQGKSEGKSTEFPDWTHPELQRFTLEFFERFAARYDLDPRIAFVQVGFGLWAEYHIYDGPMILGKTFPSKEFQSKFANHLSNTFKQTCWMISVDAADQEWTPFEDNTELQSLRFGLFDDSFNHEQHAKQNEPNWLVFGRDRWKESPMGGEFSFFSKVDQTKALSTNGPHGVSFEKHASRFHISFMIGDAQPKHQSPDRIRIASKACGYRFRVTELLANSDQTRVTIDNIGIAPIYYDAFVAVDGVRATVSLKGLLPGEQKSMTIQRGGLQPRLTVECDRLVPGQTIQLEADLQ